MLKHLFTIVCKESKIDADTNNLSINDILERVTFNIELNEDAHLTRSENDPIGLQFPFEVTVAFYRDLTADDLENDGLIRVKDPTSKLLGEFPFQIIMPKGMDRMRARLKFDTIALTVAGAYSFETYLKDSKGQLKKINDTPLTVDLTLK